MFENSFSDEQFIEALSNEDWQRTSAIAKTLGCSIQAAKNRLNKLCKLPKQERIVQKRKVKAQGRFKYAYEWKKLQTDE